LRAVNGELHRRTQYNTLARSRADWQVRILDDIALLHANFTATIDPGLRERCRSSSVSRRVRSRTPECERRFTSPVNTQSANLRARLEPSRIASCLLSRYLLQVLAETSGHSGNAKPEYAASGASPKNRTSKALGIDAGASQGSRVMSTDLLLGTSDGSPVPSMPSARTFEQDLNPAFAFARIVRPNFPSDASGGSPTQVYEREGNCTL
jgi:hypothetical protein